MCGICGKVAKDPGQRIEAAGVRRMMDSIVHRGPDDEGLYDGGQAVLGHRRLSIIDLNTGKQPITNEDGTIWIVYNGEVYNFVELRGELETKGHVFRTKTDTEVIIHLYEEYADESVKYLQGMFAFAIWDSKNRKLLLARDRVGIKPLYYCATRDALLFGSEIKAILTDPTVAKELSPQGVDRFLSFLYVPGTETLLRNVHKLEPGCYLVLQDGNISVHQYWDLQFSSPQANGNFEELSQNLTNLLRKSVRDHMISDVPVGVLLSGGVDSTAMLSFAVEETDKKINTFTIGFSNADFDDERRFSNLAAQKYGSEHYDLTISAADFQAFLPKYIWHMEEPVCEPPAVALYYVTKLARQYVKVLISGEGGDEAFAGYQNYRSMMWMERIKTLGAPWTRLASETLNGLGRISSKINFEKYSVLMGLRLQDYYFSRTSTPFSYFNENKSKLYRSDFTHQIQTDRSFLGLHELFERVSGQSVLNQMLYVDTKTWLPDDLLIKADKITMANSLELRVPLLDHNILEFAARLPVNYKVHGLTTKYILKKALEDRVPREILNRRKTGFPLPFESWLRKELRGFVRDVLLDRRTLQRGYFEPGAVHSLLTDDIKTQTHSSEIFSLLVLEMWHRQFLDAN